MKYITKKHTIILTIIVVGAALWLMKKQAPLSVEIAAIEHNVPIQVFGLGSVEARVLSNLSFQSSSAVEKLHAHEGETVRKGDVLARLDATQQRASTKKSRAGLLSAQAAVSASQAEILKAKAVLQKKIQTNKRQQTLYAKRTISAEKVEIARLELDISAADLDIAYSNQLAAKASLSMAQAQLEFDQATLEQYVLRAPYDAVVVTRHVEIGTVVRAGEPVFTLVDPATIWVLAHISESRSGSIKVGQPATIRLRSTPHKKIQGFVKRIDIQSDRITEERRIYISCDLCKASFNIGEQAEALITTTRLDYAIFVPENAVDNFNEQRMNGTVWTIENGLLKKKDVLFSHQTLDTRLSLYSPLASNVQVLNKLPKILHEGQEAIGIVP